MKNIIGTIVLAISTSALGTKRDGRTGAAAGLLYSASQRAPLPEAVKNIPLA